MIRIRIERVDSKKPKKDKTPKPPDPDRELKRRKRKIKALIALIVVLIIGGMFAVTYYETYGNPFAKDTGPIAVGLLVNQDDEQSAAIAKGAMTAIKRTNQTGGIHGNKIKVIRVNSRTKRLSKDYNKLKEKTCGMIYAGTTNRFLQSADTTVFMPEGEPVNNPNVLRFKYSQQEEAEAISQYYIHGRRDFHTGVLINIDGNLSRYNHFRKDYKKLNGKIDHIEVYGNNDQNFETQFARFKNKNVLVVYVPTLERQNLAGMNAMAHKYGITLISGNQINDYLKNDAVNCEDVIFTNSYISNKKTTRRIEKLFGKHNDNHDAVLGYDAAGFMIKALKLDASANLDKSVYLIEYHGINNTYAFDDKGNPDRIEISIVSDKGGVRHQLNKFWIK